MPGTPLPLTHRTAAHRSAGGPVAWVLTMHRRALVPQREVADLPFVLHMEPGIVGDVHQFAKQSTPLFEFHVFDVIHEAASQIDKPSPRDVVVAHEFVSRAITVAFLEAIEEVVVAKGSDDLVVEVRAR